MLSITLPGVVTTSTCSSSISTNTTYIRNPGYPSSYTASSATTCTFTFYKVTAQHTLVADNILGSLFSGVLRRVPAEARFPDILRVRGGLHGLRPL